MTMEWRHPLSSPHYTVGPYNSDLCSTTVSQPFTTLLASFTCWCLVMTIYILFEYLLPQHCLDFAITCTYKTHATLWKCKVNVRFGLSLMMCNFTSTGCGYPLRAPHKLSTWSASQDALLIVGGSKFPWYQNGCLISHGAPSRWDGATWHSNPPRQLKSQSFCGRGRIRSHVNVRDSFWWAGLALLLRLQGFRVK